MKQPRITFTEPRKKSRLLTPSSSAVADPRALNPLASLGLNMARPRRSSWFAELPPSLKVWEEILTAGQITGANQLLAGVPANVVQAAENELKKLNVDVVKDVKIVNAKTSDSGKTELTLSSGDTITCDLYLPTVGVVVNTEWLSKDLLNDKGDLMVDEFLKVKNAPGIWAAGDVTDVQSKQFVCAGLCFPWYKHQ
jgi:hypothetical protein